MVTKEMLECIPLFEGQSQADLENVAGYLTLKQYAKGEIIFDEDSGGRSLYIIKEGSVRVKKKANEGEEQTLAILKAGEFFGEMSILDGKPHSATVSALRDSTILTLSVEKFEQLLADNISSGYQLLHRLCLAVCRLLRQMDEKFIDMIKFVWEFGGKT